MITPSHIIYGWASAKGSEEQPDKSRTLAFVIGSILPDTPTYLFFVVQAFVLQVNQRTIWRELYFDSGWTPFITMSHSLLLWPALLLASYIYDWRITKYVTTAAILHISLDFLVHNDDAYAHFWPLTDWKFFSPVSYWDPSHYGTIVSMIDAIVIVGLLGWLGCLYKPNRVIQIVVSLLIVLYVVMQAVTLFIV